MSTIRKTITLTAHHDDWIKRQIVAGHYTNDSECVRDLIRRAQAQDDDVLAIRAALLEGERSGPPEPFDPAEFKRAMRQTGG